MTTASASKFNKMTLPELFQYIMDRDDVDDFRDLFQHIHNWGYNTDFTYQTVTDPEQSNLKAYVIRYIEDTEE